MGPAETLDITKPLAAAWLALSGPPQTMSAGETGPPLPSAASTGVSMSDLERQETFRQLWLAVATSGGKLRIPRSIIDLYAGLPEVLSHTDPASGDLILECRAFPNVESISHRPRAR